MTRLSPEAQAFIRAEIANAAHGTRTRVAQMLGAQFGVHQSTIYNIAKRGGTARKRAPQKPEYRDWVKIAIAIAHQSPNQSVPLDLAIRAGIESGLLPPEAADMPQGSANRIVRELDLRPKKRRTHRMFADYPMQAVQIDGSSSQHLTVADYLPDGDFVLKLHRKRTPAGGYKNKPLGADRLRLWVYGVWDMCTGYTLSRYTVARAENATDAMDFLCWALAEKEDARIPFEGVVDDLWSDQGALFKSNASKDLLARLGINLASGVAGNKERQGGVERAWRAQWKRFEAALFLRGQDEILLSELNACLLEYSIEENQKRISRTPVAGQSATRHDAWIALTNARAADNRLRKLPGNPLETMAQEVSRMVDRNGIMRWNNMEYELPSWHLCRVIARRAMDESDTIIVEHAETGDREIVMPLQRRSYGEVRTSEAAALDTHLTESAHINDHLRNRGADIWAPQTSGGNIVSMPTRSTAAADLPNPLNADYYASLDAAMTAFRARCPLMLDSAQLTQIRAHIEANKLSKAEIDALAADIMAANTQAGHA